jgi:hypothetical protein
MARWFLLPKFLLDHPHWLPSQSNRRMLSLAR